MKRKKSKNIKKRRGGQGKNLVLYIGYYQLVFAQYFNELGGKVDELRDMMTESVLRNFLSILNPPVEFYSGESIEILKTLGKALEDKIASIVGNHCIYYWIHLYRRLAPKNTFEHRSLVSVSLYRETMEAAFVKYGSLDIGNDLIRGQNVNMEEVMSGEVSRIQQKELGRKLGGKITGTGSGAYIKEFSIGHFVELLSLERLVSEFCFVAAGLRRAYKGGRLVVENVESYYVVNDDKTESLIQSYDRRNEKFGAATIKGVPVSSGMNEFNGEKKSLICMVPKYNVERYNLEKLPQDKVLGLDLPINGQARKEMEPNYVFVPFDLRSYYLRHKFIGEDFYKLYGFSLECFIQCILALVYMMVLKFRESGNVLGFELMQRAYIAYTSFESIIEVVESVLKRMDKTGGIPEIGEYKPNIDEIRSFLKKFTLDVGERINIDLVTRSERPLIIETWSGNYILDYSSILGIIHKSIQMKDAEWTGKGGVFEEYVIEELSRSDFNLWEKRRVLKGYDGTKEEIDLSFILGTAMFVCECRSIGRSKGYERGEKESLEFRKMKFKKGLEDNDRLAKWLSCHRKGTNYEIPEGVNIIIPVVVSPFVEYIWSTEDELWITKDIPRVCTIGELASITNREILTEIVGRPFVEYIK